MALENWQRATIKSALTDAVEFREPRGTCRDCDQAQPQMCPAHIGDWTLTQAYKVLAASLEITLYQP